MAVPPAHRMAWGRLGPHSPCQDQPAATFPAAIGLVVVGQPPCSVSAVAGQCGRGVLPPPGRPTMAADHVSPPNRGRAIRISGRQPLVPRPRPPGSGCDLLVGPPHPQTLHFFATRWTAVPAVSPPQIVLLHPTHSMAWLGHLQWGQSGARGWAGQLEGPEQGERACKGGPSAPTSSSSCSNPWPRCQRG